MLRYDGYAITMQEVPDEISLCLNITGCLGRCEGCHSPHLRLSTGQPLRDDIEAMLARYDGMITCVCFMGEGNDPSDLFCLLPLVKGRGLKTCLYSGRDEIGPLGALIPVLDYLKLGSYRYDLGGLGKTTTNQRFYAVNGNELVDITYRFHRKKDDQ